MQEYYDKKESPDESEIPAGPDRYKITAGAFPAIAGVLCELNMLTASVTLKRFDESMRAMGLSTLVPGISHLREIGFNAHHFLQVAARKGDPLAETGFAKLKMMTHGSPKARYILSQLRKFVVSSSLKQPGQKNKFILCEDGVAVAFFWEILCRFVYIDCETLHAGLSNVERAALVKRFNGPTTAFKSS